jgi:hypothetical protein
LDAKPGDVAALPDRLDGMLAVMLTHERDGPGTGHAIEDGNQLR